MPLFLYFVIALTLVLLSGIRICQEYERAIVFRLGRYIGIKGPGLYYLIPILDTKRVVDLRTRTIDVERQETITRDSVSIKVNAVLWYKIMDPSLAILSVANYEMAVYQVALTTLRNTIGQHDLDEVLKGRDAINKSVMEKVDKDTDAWGIKIEMVEMKDVEIPEALQRAMAREAEAIREKRARIIKAEAEQEASVKLSEGAKKIAENPIALELRRMQMVAEIGAEQNSTTVFIIPSEFINLATSANEFLRAKI